MHRAIQSHRLTHTAHRLIRTDARRGDVQETYISGGIFLAEVVVGRQRIIIVWILYGLRIVTWRERSSDLAPLVCWCRHQIRIIVDPSGYSWTNRISCWIKICCYNCIGIAKGCNCIGRRCVVASSSIGYGDSDIITINRAKCMTNIIPICLIGASIVKVPQGRGYSGI